MLPACPSVINLTMMQLSWNDRVLKLQKVSNVASSLVALLSCLPPTLLCKWLSCAEINELFSYGNVSFEPPVQKPHNLDTLSQESS